MFAQADKGAQRLGWAHEQARIFTRQFANAQPVEAVFMEVPRGRVHPALWQMYGVLRAAMYSELERGQAFPVTVFEINPSEWQKRTVGSRKSHADYEAWARMVGDPANEDEAAALCIAHAGQMMLGEQ